VNAVCAGTHCPASEKPAADAAMAKGWVANVSLGIGVAGVVAGVIVLAVQRRPSAAGLVPSPQGLAVRF
jgi:hypothetical protein